MVLFFGLGLAKLSYGLLIYLIILVLWSYCFNYLESFKYFNSCKLYFVKNTYAYFQCIIIVF
jgi:hypothetical protein